MAVGVRAAQPKIVSSNPNVAMASASHCPAPAREVIENCHTGNSNMRWTAHTPATAPMICEAMYPAAIGHGSSRRNANARLTAGLKCAPESGPKIRISTTKIAPVGMVLHRSASATFPPESLSAMMPEPTTAASRNAVPSHSAKMHRASDGIRWPKSVDRRAARRPL
jgi:hypothetical protein